MNYFSRKSLSKYFMCTIDFSKHDIDIFINDMWQKYVSAIHIYLFKITSLLELRVIIIPLSIFNQFDYIIKYMLPLFN